MKRTNIIIVVILIALCAFGWVSMTSQSAEKSKAYETAIDLAAGCMERGLYQRAIENYLTALDGKADEDVYLDIANAYSLRYEEAPEDTYDGYLKFLKGALDVFPGNQDLVDCLIALCINQERGIEDYKTLYVYLKKAISNGYDDEYILDLYAHARYHYSLHGNTFQAIFDSGTEEYVVVNERGWNIYSPTGGYQLTSNWPYVGPVGDDGVTVITGEDSRIFNSSTAMVLGIFEEPVTAAGIFSEGLIPALVNGKYDYYNDYADYQFGSYDDAGTFQDGLAAVRKGGEWLLINAKGETERDDFEEILLDPSGRYIVNDTIVVKQSGEYVVYNSKWKNQAEFACDEVDRLSKDGVIAFRDGKKWGFMDMTGKVVIEPAYAAARSFSNGLAAVQGRDGLWGFVDKTGRPVIDCAFTDVGYMNDAGVCPVRVDIPVTEPVYDRRTGEEIVIPEEWKLLSLTNGITED